MDLKATRIILLFGIIILWSNIDTHAQCDSLNATINSKIRYLGSWLPNGKLQYFTTPDTISQEIKDAVANALPEGVDITGTTLFDPDVKPNTELTDSAGIYLTFVQEVASWKNSLGFYTYDVDNPPSTYEEIDSLTLIFPNLDAPNIVKPGDKVYLGKFGAGTGIGYFLIGNGWTGDTVCLRNHMIFTDKNLNSYTVEENRQKTVLFYFEEKLLLGIEDKIVNPDSDYNDAVFYITADNFDAIDTVDIPKIPVAEISGDTVLCSDDELAEITIEIFGTPPFEIVYNDGTQDILVENINSSIYTFQTSVRDSLTLVSVKNGTGYGVVKGSAIVQQSSVNAYFTIGEIDICEDATGVPAEVTLEGFPPFTLTYNEDDAEITINNITGTTVDLLVSVGKTYVLAEVQDKYCQTELDDSLAFNVFEAPSATIEDIDTTLCAGVPVEVNFSFEGSGPFTFIYTVNGINDTVTTSESVYKFNVTEDAEIVPVKIIDAQCESIQVTGVAKINFNAVPTFEIVAPAVGCDDKDAITLTINLAGEAPFDYSYDIDGTVFDESTAESSFEVELQLGERFELLTFSDANCDGNVDENESVFHHHPSPSATIVTETSAICDGASVAIEIKFQGQGPWTTVISDGIAKDTIVSASPSYTYNTSTPGTYELLTVWNNNCSNGEVSGQANVIISEIPTVSVEAENNSICSGNPAVIGLAFTGTGPWTFEVKTDDAVNSYVSENEIFDLEVSDAGLYEIVNLSDAYCSSSATADFEVVENESPTAAISGGGTVCVGQSVSLHVELTGTAPFQFTYTDGTSNYTISTDENEYTIETAATGTYSIVEVQDANCSGTFSGEAVVDNSITPVVDFTGDNILCEGGEARLSMVFTGTAPFNFTLKNGASETAYTTNEGEYEIFVSQEGAYEIINFLDANCAGESVEAVVVTLSEKPTASISLEGTGDICGDEKVTIVIDLTGTAPFNVTYTDGIEELSVSTDENQYSFETSASGIYSVVSVSDANCSGTASGEVEIKNLVDELTGNITGEDYVCEGDDIAIGFESDGEVTSYEWTTSGSGELNVVSLNEAHYIPAEGETGIISFTLEISNDCASETFTKEIEITPAPVATFSLFPEDLLTNTSITFAADNEEYDNYIWDFGDGNVGSGNPVTHTYDEPGKYEIALTVENGGCIGEGAVEGIIKTKNDLYVPNVFNPNALNTENQVVKVYGTNISEEGFSFKIVNRWGHTMYQTNSFLTANSQGWGGKEHNNDEMQSLSAFTYILRGKFNDGETFERTGTITILQ